MHYLRAGIYLETFLVHKWGTDLFVEWSNNELSNVTSEVARRICKSSLLGRYLKKAIRLDTIPLLHRDLHSLIISQQNKSKKSVGQEAV